VTTSSLVKLHEKSGHMSATAMEKWLRRSENWDDNYKESIQSIVTKCQCSEASHPQGHPKVSRGQLVAPVAYGEDLCVDIIYLKGCPFLHAIDRYSTFSVIRMLMSRSASEIEKALADMLDIISTSGTSTITVQTLHL
jgi:hypothetical protein